MESIDQIDDPDVVDQWAQVMSSMTGVPSFNKAKQADFKVPQEQVNALKKAKVKSAIEEIVKRARHTSIVILNENHLDPRGRAFGLEVAEALKPLGYTILAVEAIKPFADEEEAKRKMAQLRADTYVRAAGDFYSGYYFNDPVYADFIHQALKMGYNPVSYETAGRGYTNQEREEAQVDNLIRRAISASPGSKILIYLGERHAAENPMLGEENPYQKFAEILKAKTGIDPLTIDQAGLSPIPMNRPDVDLHEIVASKVKRSSVVLFHNGKPVTTGLLAGAVDLQVVHPSIKWIHGRPDWLLTMGRVPTPIPEELLSNDQVRLIQVFLEEATPDARPIDQVLVVPGQEIPFLMLPKAKVRYAIQDFNNL